MITTSARVFLRDRRTLAAALLAAAVILVSACADSPALTTHAADALLEEHFADAHRMYNVPDELGLPSGLTFRTYPDDSPVGRLLKARLITRAEMPDEIFSVAGNFLGGMGRCFRVSLNVQTGDPSAMKGSYIAERRLSCPESAGPSRQAGAIDGSYDPNALVWRVRFSPALHGAAPDAALKVGVDRARALHWDGQAGETDAHTLSLVAERPARTITVTKYRYNVSKTLAAARDGKKIVVGRYVVDSVEGVVPADATTVRAPFAWHVLTSDVGEAIAPAPAVRGKGDAVFERRGSEWSVKTVTLDR